MALNEWGWEDFEEGSENTAASELVVKDAHGTVLVAGDTVVAIKDLKVKGGGGSSDIKRGDKFKNIRLTDNIEEIEVGKLVLRTEFFKKL